MKKTLAIILSACMLFAMISCDFSSLLDEDTSEKATDEITTTEETTKKPQPLNNKNVTIEEQVLIDHEGFKVTAKSFEDGLLGPNIKILVENNTDKNITLIPLDTMVNDYMIQGSISCDITAGKTANDIISFKNTDLKEAGINAIGKFELYLNIYETVSFDDIYTSDCITIKTSIFDDVEIVKRNKGEEFLNKEGLSIFGYYSEKESKFGRSIELFFDNNTNENINVRIKDFSINGYMVSIPRIFHVCKGKMAVNEIAIINAYLEDNNITKIDKIEFKFEVLSYETWLTLLESDVITININ